MKDQKDAEIHIPGYHIFSSDRTRTKRSLRARDSGGVAFYVRDDIATTFEPLITYSDGVIEMLCIYSKHEHLLLTTLYRQPDNHTHGFKSSSTQYANAINLLTNTINSIREEEPDIILGGDFNLPHAKWPLMLSNTINQNQRNHIGEEKKMLLITQSLQSNLNLTQMVLNTTHTHGNILDLVFTNNTSLVYELQIIPTLKSTSDHFILEFSSSYKPTTTTSTGTTTKHTKNGFNSFNFFHDSINWNEIEESFNNTDWTTLFSKSKSTTEMLDAF